MLIKSIGGNNLLKFHDTELSLPHPIDVIGLHHYANPLSEIL